MKIFKPWPAEGYESCLPASEDDFETILSLVNGESRGSTWTPLQMELVRSDAGTVLLKGDAPWLGSHALVLRPRAVEAMESLLRQCGELLPISCEGESLLIYNPRVVPEALDEDQSDVRRFDSGRIKHIQRYVFRTESVRGLPAFKIPQLRRSPTFVSESFVDRWTTSGLRGVEFELVWSGPD